MTLQRVPPSIDPQPGTSDIVFLESVRQYSRNVERFKATEHYEEFRFVNPDRINSSDQGVIAIHQAVQTFIERLLHDVGPNDFFQLRFQGQGLNSPLFTRRSSRDVFDVVTFLENLSKLLQSKAELLAYGTFRIIALIVRGREGGASRTLKSVIYSKIISKKYRWLLDFNTGATNMCLVVSIAGLLMERATPDHFIMSMAADTHEALQILPNRLVGFGGLGLFENHFAVTVKVPYHSGSWKYFTTDERVKNKTVYVLHHDNHFYGILNVKGFVGAKYMCEHSDHIYNNRTRHQFEMHCKMCQRDGCVDDASQKVNCSTCKMFCRLQDCLNVNVSLAQCDRKSDCRTCGCYKASKHNCKELKAYCQADVMILRKACNLFKDVVVEMTKRVSIIKIKSRKRKEIVEYLDPFKNITLTSMCMSIYQHVFLKPETIALVPPDLYNGKQKRYSTPSIQWLMYFSEKENIFIQHALQGSEYRLGRYYLDGYALINGVPTAFEFNGCFYHRCPLCYKPHEFNRLQGTTFEHLHRRTLVKAQYIENSSFVLRTLWEHEWLDDLAKDAELSTFIKSRQLPSPLEPRDALFCGRTNAIQLYRVAGEGEKIHYYDLTSLYPYVKR
ncbi:hypothetical protein NDU88_004257 [Pleurodeles waltl]|uniref:DNA-directed DNA polymerase n=1 Tax=Pleurodeles waltl TaxID=8319 RepID=A0AAV7MUM7_PLEWA|nr:hypothetical protein NDU88_004257 [Pleurodeles waltl]